MLKLAHIINVTEINESKKNSYLHIAQPVTMKSMSIARQHAKGVVEVDLYAVKHASEKVEILPEFRWAPNIEKYAWEYIDSLKNVTPHRPLPRIADIIQALYDSSNADYFIYTNLDIGLYPDFYILVSDYIKKGYDAFCINRRILPTEYDGVLLDQDKMELIFRIKGDKHPGIDCFVFKRQIVPLLNFGNTYIGYPPVGLVLLTQIKKNSKKFIWLKDKFVTFHLGHDQGWRVGKNKYYRENYNQAQLVLGKMRIYMRIYIRKLIYKIKRLLVLITTIKIYVLLVGKIYCTLHFRAFLQS